MTTLTDDTSWSPIGAPLVTVGGGAVAGTLDFAGDADLFRIQMLQDSGYLIELTAASAAGAHAQLLTPAFFPAGTTVAIGAGRILVAYTADIEATHYVEVTSATGATGAYSLRAAAAQFHLGTGGHDFLSGGGGADIFHGLSGDDEVMGGGGTDYIDGSYGIDMAIYAGPRTNYAVQVLGGGRMLVTDGIGGDGEDILLAVERLQFADGPRAFDIDGHAGDVARVLGAVFDEASLHNPAYVGIGLSLADGGMDIEALMQVALDAALGSGATNEQVVTLLYTNIVGSAPSPADLAAYVSLLEGGEHTHASLGVLAALSEANDAQIGIEVLGSAGIGYA
jgi:hypothetical protein